MQYIPWGLVYFQALIQDIIRDLDYFPAVLQEGHVIRCDRVQTFGLVYCPAVMQYIIVI